MRKPSPRFIAISDAVSEVLFAAAFVVFAFHIPNPLDRFALAAAEDPASTYHLFAGALQLSVKTGLVIAAGVMLTKAARSLNRGRRARATATD